MTTKHTPGPWKLKLARFPNGKLAGVPYVFAPNGPDTYRHVCQPFFDDAASPEIRAQQEANARLIAAAPELIEALRAVVNSAVRHRWKTNSDEPDTLNAAMDTLAKYSKP